MNPSESFRDGVTLPTLRQLAELSPVDKDRAPRVIGQATCIPGWTRKDPQDPTRTMTRWYCISHNCVWRDGKNPLVAMTCQNDKKPPDTLYNRCPANFAPWKRGPNELWPSEDAAAKLSDMIQIKVTAQSGNDKVNWYWTPNMFSEGVYGTDCLDFYETGPDQRTLPGGQDAPAIGINNLLGDTSLQYKGRNVYEDFHAGEYDLYTSNVSPFPPAPAPPPPLPPAPPTPITKCSPSDLMAQSCPDRTECNAWCATMTGCYNKQQPDNCYQFADSCYNQATQLACSKTGAVACCKDEDCKDFTCVRTQM